MDTHFFRTYVGQSCALVSGVTVRFTLPSGTAEDEWSVSTWFDEANDRYVVKLFSLGSMHQIDEVPTRQIIAHRLILQDYYLNVDNKRYGSIRPGDSVFIHEDRVFVNGEERKQVPKES